jgi:hypothetical protein
MSQNQLVLNHLIDHGYVTEIIARSYGIRRLASRIHDLKAIGLVRVQKEMRTDDLKVPYAYYSLSESERAFERLMRDNGMNWSGGDLKKAAA